MVAKGHTKKYINWWIMAIGGCYEIYDTETNV